MLRKLHFRTKELDGVINPNDNEKPIAIEID